MGGELLINVDDVSRVFGSHRALSNISFTLLRGEVLGFLGPNGAGKSTTMRIICGVLSPTSGRVTIAGYDIVEDATRAKTHRRDWSRGSIPFRYLLARSPSHSSAEGIRLT